MVTWNRSFTCCLVMLLIVGGAALAGSPPVAPVKPVVDEYHGVKVTDPYRYMENLDDPDVQAWLKAEAEYTEDVMNTIPGRDKLVARIKELDSGTTEVVRGITRLPGGKLFYRKRLADEDQYKLYVRENGVEKLLVDPEVFREKTGVPHAINYYTASPGGKYVAYGVSAGGSEDATLYVLETATGEQVETPIERAQFGAIGWLPDESGFGYFQLRELGPDDPPTEKYQRSGSRFHMMGTDPADDPVVFNADMESVDLPPTDIPFMITVSGSDYAFGMVTTGVSPELQAIYKVPLSKINGMSTPWELICRADEKVSSMTVQGDDLYMLTFKDAPRYKVIRTSLSNPDLASAATVIPAGEAVIKDINTAKDGIYVSLMEAGVGKLMRIPNSGAKPEEIKLPLLGRLTMADVNPQLDGAVFMITAWTKATAIYQYDPATGKVTDTKLQPLGKYDAPDNLVSKLVMVKSYDGVEVPLTIVHNKSLQMNGKNPTFLMGYGAYGISIDPYFTKIFLPWFEHGGIMAVAHIRGGGEFGEEWHMAGFKQTKPNTWKDFIACAEYLVDNKYTSPAYLAGNGGSAGGITIGRAITERPDLFGVALPQVGSMDCLRAETTPNGVPNIPEFGTVKDPEEFKALLEMSAYHHVKDGVAYPATMLTHGMNDPRVEPWQTAKIGARLQAATSSGKPVLLRLEYEGGHGVGSTRSQTQEEFADLFAFAFWQMGVDGFQPMAGQ